MNDSKSQLIDAVFSGFNAAQATMNGAVQLAQTADQAISTISDMCSRRDPNYQSGYAQNQQPNYRPASYVWASQPNMYGGGYPQQIVSGYPGISNDGYGKIGYTGTGYTGGFNFQVPTGSSGAWYSDPRIGGGQW